MLPAMEVVLSMPLRGVLVYGSPDEACCKRGDRRSICEWEHFLDLAMLEEVLALSSHDF